MFFYCDFIGSEQHFLAEKIEHLSPLYAVGRFNSRQQLGSMRMNLGKCVNFAPWL